MPVPAINIQNQIISQLGANSNLSVEFSGKISKGLGRNFNFDADGQGIRVYLAASDQYVSEITTGRKESRHSFLIIVLFYEPNEVEGEIRKANYDAWVRDAIESDLSLNNLAYNVDMDNTQHREDPKVDGLHYVVIPVVVFTQEMMGAS